MSNTTFGTYLNLLSTPLHQLSDLQEFEAKFLRLHIKGC